MKQELFDWLRTLPYTNNEYLVAFAIFIIFRILAKVVEIIFNKYLQKIVAKTETEIDDVIVKHTKKPLFYFIIVYGLKLASEFIITNNTITKISNSLMALVFLLIILRVLDVLIHTWGFSFAKKTKTRLDEVLLPLLHKVANIIFVIVGFIWVLSIWQINITPYLAGVGISGLVLGLALQDSLKNIFGGISMILDKNFNLGDPVSLESGELGLVKEIGLRSTKILTFDSELIFVPNGQLANMKVRNYLKPNNHVRKIVEFGVEYGSDVEKVKKVVLVALKKIKDIHPEPYIDVIFVEMADFSLKFKARFFVDWENAYKKWVEATQAIHASLIKAKIGIPFPTRTVYMKKK